MSLVLLLWSFFFRGGQKNFLVQFRLSFSSIPSRRKKTFDKNDNRNLVMPDLFNSLMLLSGSGRILLFLQTFLLFQRKMKPNHLVDNILQATEVLSKQFSGGWKNIRAIHVKTETSIAIPLHISKASPNDIGFVDTKAPIKKVKEDITDELSTIPDVNVTVMPDFSLKVDGLDKKEHQIEDIQENSDVDEEDSEEKDPAEEKTKSKKRKLEKKKGKEASSTTKDNKSSKKKKMAEVESSDDEDDEIEEAENAYLQKNNENQVSNEEENKDDQESEDDEEDGDDDGSGEEESEDE